MRLCGAVDAPDDPGAAANRRALNRVLYNLVANGIKYTSEGGVEVTVTAENDHVLMSVADTGIGIEQAFVADLFQEFKRSRRVVDSGYEGTGLGLAISKRLVERMGGSIAVESIPDQGTTFTVKLRRA